MANYTGPQCDCNATEEVRSITSPEFTYTWKISNFKFIHPGVGECISTGNFGEQSLWTAFVYPDGYDSEHSAFMGIAILFNRDMLPLDYSPYQLRIYFIDKRGREIEMYRSQETFTNYTSIKNFTTKHFVLEEGHKSLLPNNTLTIRFKTYYLGEDIDRCKLDSIVSPTSQSTQNRLESIFNNEKFSDVKIAVDDKIFYAYKGILASHSSVFAAMFEHDMKENTENIVHIIDIDHEVMHEILRFIYTGKVNNIDVIACDLLAAADKYELEQLKTTCEETIINNLKVENVTSLLIQAEKYRAKKLKEGALKLFKTHAKQIIKTEDFKRDLSKLPFVFTEIIESLVS